MRHPLLFAVLAAFPALAAAQSVQPGNWEIVTTVESIELPGAPAGIAAMMKGRPLKVSHCVTPEEAARGPQDMIKARKECQFARYSMTGGKLSSEMTCKQGGSSMTTTVDGSFTATSFTTSGRTVATGGRPMTMTATTVGHRIGDCR